MCPTRTVGTGVIRTGLIATLLTRLIASTIIIIVATRTVALLAGLAGLKSSAEAFGAEAALVIAALESRTVCHRMLTCMYTGAR